MSDGTGSVGWVPTQEKWFDAVNRLARATPRRAADVLLAQRRSGSRTAGVALLLVRPVLSWLVGSLANGPARPLHTATAGAA